MVASINLLEGCKQGDSRAQRMLYDQYKGRLMGLCRRYTRDRDEAQDVLQEAFIKIFSKLDQLEAPEKLEGWMRSIAIRTSINHYRKTKSLDLVFSKVSDSAMESVAHEIELTDFTDELLVDLIHKLPDGCRMVFNLFVVEGYNHEEIGTMLTISEGTSRSQLHYAKYLLKEKLKGYYTANRSYEKLS